MVFLLLGASGLLASKADVRAGRGKPPQLARAAFALPAAASTLGSAVGPVGGVEQ